MGQSVRKFHRLRFRRGHSSSRGCNHVAGGKTREGGLIYRTSGGGNLVVWGQ